MDEANILVATQDETGYIRVIGKGSFKNAKLLKSFYDATRTSGVSRFVIDLQQCKHMDSTFMGVLAGLATEQRKQQLPCPKCVHLSPRNRELLETLGLDKILELAQQPENNSDIDFQALDAITEDKVSAAQTMLEAHENLIHADARNATKFQDVVKFLRHKLDGESSSH